VWGSRGIAAYIHNLCSRWKQVIGFTPWLLYLDERNPRCVMMNRRLGLPQDESMCFGEKKMLPYQESYHDSLVIQPVA
jgi:hypothetical protein